MHETSTIRHEADESTWSPLCKNSETSISLNLSSAGKVSGSLSALATFLLTLNPVSALHPTPMHASNGGVPCAISYPIHRSVSTKEKRSNVLVAEAAAPSARPAQALQLTTFFFVLGLALVQLTPAEHLIKMLGVKSGTELLIALASLGAAAEIALSPIIGGLADSMGRKSVLIGALALALLVNLLVVMAPSVATIAISKFFSSFLIGAFFLAIDTILADNYRIEPKKLAAMSGIFYALVNLGYGLGIALCGLLPPSLSLRYACSCSAYILGFAPVVFAVRESLPQGDRKAFKVHAFNPFAFTKLLTAGKKMRWLAVLALLLFAPLHMGDTLQVFMLNQWKMNTMQIAQVFTGITVSSIIANTIGGSLVKFLGLRKFSAVAICSTLLFWVGLACGNVKLAISCMVIGLLAHARRLGVTTMMMLEGGKLGIPQGQLSGERANLEAWLKVIGPIVYGQLYVHGAMIGVPQAPFYLNIVLMIGALALGSIVLVNNPDKQPKSQRQGA